METIPKVASWPTIEDVCISLDRQEVRSLRIRRRAWEVTVSDIQVANRWIYYFEGIWFIEDTAGKRIVAADEFTEDDFYGQDWTSLSVACYQEDVSCDSVSESYLIGYYYREETSEFQPDISSPNAPACGDACALPAQPPSVYVPISTDSSGGGDGGGGGGGGGNGTGKTRKSRKRKQVTSASLTLGTPDDDIPDCLELGEDECGRKCNESAVENPHPYTVNHVTVSLSDPDNPSDLWFVKVYYKGVLYGNETMRHGDSADININQDSLLRWGASHGIRASAWKSNSPEISDSKSVTMAEPCEPDPDCGESCSGS